MEHGVCEYTGMQVQTWPLWSGLVQQQNNCFKLALSLLAVVQTGRLC
jgi:hypothetical protein